VYPIERIVRAEMIGGGWRLQVKWLGFPHPTPEPLKRILKQTKGHSEVLEQIDHCKSEWLLANPSAARAAQREAPAQPVPTSSQPARDRDQPRRFMFHITQLDESDSRWLVPSGLAALRRASQLNCSVLTLSSTDYSEYAVRIPACL
jgi:hypothetical protein